MSNSTPEPASTGRSRTNYVLGGVAVGFFVIAALLFSNVWGHPPARQKIALVDRAFLETTPWRQTYADLARAKEDLSDYDCYACHEKGKPPPLRFDEQKHLIIPKEHGNIVMGHGTHDRNNLCFNCHNENNLETLQSRDGNVIKFDTLPQLCGSCHGPTYRDWEAGAHGRTSGYWNHQMGDISRLSCANCHNPHSPRIPTRQPAPPPHPLRETAADHHQAESETTH